MFISQVNVWPTNFLSPSSLVTVQVTTLPWIAICPNDVTSSWPNLIVNPLNVNRSSSVSLNSILPCASAPSW